MPRKIEVQIIGDDRSFRNALSGASGAGSAFGRSMLRVGAIAAGGFAVGVGGAIKAAVDFESSFAGIRKTVGGSEKDLKQLSDGMLALSRRIPVNVNALNEIGEAAGQLGVERKSILKFTEVIAKLGVSSNLAGEEGAAMLARFANITKMPQGQFDRLGATIVALGNAGASTESEIAEMGLRIAGAATQVGIAQPQILGIANALSSVGIEAEAGGTAISQVMVKIAKGVDAGGKTLSGFAKVAGMSSQQFAQSWRTDAAGALVTFIEGLGRVKSSGGSVFQVLEQLGLSGIRVQDTLLRASGAGDLLRKSLDLGARAWQQNIALNKEAEQRFKTTASQYQLLKNNIMSVAIVLGSRLLPAFNTALLAATGFFGKLSKADGWKAKANIVWTGTQEAGRALFQKIQSAVRGIDWAGLFAGAQGIASGIATSIGTAMASVDWTATGAAIVNGIGAALSAAGTLATTLMGTIHTALAGVNWEEVGKVIGPALATAVITGFALLMDPMFWIRNWDAALAIASITMPGRVLKIAGMIGKPFAMLGGLAVREFGRGFAEAFPTITGAISRVVPAVVGGLRNLPGAIAAAAGNASRLLGLEIGGWARSAGALAARVPGAVLTGLRALAPNVEAAIRLALGRIRSTAAAWLSAGTLLAGRVVAGVTQNLARLAGAVLGPLAQASAAVVGTVEQFFSAAAAIGRAIVEGVLSGIAGLAQRVGARIAGAVRGAIDWASKNVGSTAAEHASRMLGVPMGEGVIRGWILGTASLPSKLSETVRNAIERAREAVAASRGRFTDAWSQMANDALAGFDRAWAKVKTKTEKMLAEGTASEKKLAEMDRQDRERRLSEGKSTADTRLAEAEQGIGFEAREGETPQEAADREKRRQEAIASARREVEDAQRAIDRARLEDQAAVERADAEKKAAAERAELDDRIALRRRHFEARLAALATALEREGTTHKNANAKILALFRSFIPGYKGSGKSLGVAFAQGLTESIGAVSAAAEGVADAAGKKLKLKSPAEEGPMADLDRWWRPFAATLLEGFDPSAISDALTRGIPTPGGSDLGATAAATGARGGDTYNFEFPQYVGSRDELIRVVRSELYRVKSRNGTLEMG